MNVITKYPIVLSGSDAESAADYRGTYSGFFGSGAVRRARQKSRQKRGDTFIDRVGKGAKKLMGNPLVQGLLGGRGNQGDGGGYSEPSYTPEPTKEGLSTGAKIGIGVGIIAVVGIGAYLLTRKK
jgi:hypothetical protein